jgi:hypothetical protein
MSNYDKASLLIALFEQSKILNEKESIMPQRHHSLAGRSHRRRIPYPIRILVALVHLIGLFVLLMQQPEVRQILALLLLLARHHT